VGFCHISSHVVASRASARRAGYARFRTRVDASIEGFTTRKKNRAGPLYDRADGRFEAQNARIGANRFALAARFATARRASRRSCAEDSRLRFVW